MGASGEAVSSTAERRTAAAAAAAAAALPDRDGDTGNSSSGCTEGDYSTKTAGQ